MKLLVAIKLAKLAKMATVNFFSNSKLCLHLEFLNYVTEFFTRPAWLVAPLLLVWFEGEESQLRLDLLILHQMTTRRIQHIKLQKYNGCRHIWHESGKRYAVVGNHQIL